MCNIVRMYIIYHTYIIHYCTWYTILLYIHNIYEQSNPFRWRDLPWNVRVLCTRDYSTAICYIEFYKYLCIIIIFSFEVKRIISMTHSFICLEPIIFAKKLKATRVQQHPIGTVWTILMLVKQYYYILLYVGVNARTHNANRNRFFLKYFPNCPSNRKRYRKTRTNKNNIHNDIASL